MNYKKPMFNRFFYWLSSAFYGIGRKCEGIAVRHWFSLESLFARVEVDEANVTIVSGPTQGQVIAGTRQLMDTAREDDEIYEALSVGVEKGRESKANPKARSEKQVRHILRSVKLNQPEPEDC